MGTLEADLDWLLGFAADDSAEPASVPPLLELRRAASANAVCAEIGVGQLALPYVAWGADATAALAKLRSVCERRKSEGRARIEWRR
jgi:hypothetical protein